MPGKAKEEQGGGWDGRDGTYILADGLVNGYPHWLLKTGDGSQAIWFNKVTSSWFVGPKKDLGTNTGGISGPNGKDSYPNEIKQGWRYGDLVQGTPTFLDLGPNDVIFKAIGTFFKPLLNKINSAFLLVTLFKNFKNCF